VRKKIAEVTRLSRLITICQRAAKAIPLISHTDRAETSGTDRADCDGTRFAGAPFWQKPQPVLRSVAFPSEVPSIRELFFGESRGRPCSRILRLSYSVTARAFARHLRPRRLLAAKSCPIIPSGPGRGIRTSSL